MAVINIDPPSRTRYRVALAHLGFRPFFLLAGLFAVLGMAGWALFYRGLAVLPGGLPAMIWHGHEMIFGYGGAVAAGFLLTAVRNWTNIQTLHGGRLLALAGLWVLARLGLASGFPMWASALADMAFDFWLAAAVILPLRKGGKGEDALLFGGKLLVLALANALFYIGALGWLADGIAWGLTTGLYLLLALIFTMGRRVIPFFIEKGIGGGASVVNYAWVDRLSLWPFVAFWLADTAFPDGWAARGLALLLAVVHLFRLLGWHHRGIWSRPLLWVLYLAYGWIVFGFLLKALGPALSLSPMLALHAFAVGGIGLVTVGMMARVALGHTGRNVLEPPRSLMLVFALVALAAVFRVLLPVAAPQLYPLWVSLAQGAWIAAFVVFCALYAPMLVLPRIDGRYG